MIITQAGCTGVTSAKGTSSSDPTTSAKLAVTPTALNFGNVAVGAVGNQSLVVTNSGTSVITISQASALGTGFGVLGASFPITLTAGSSFTFTMSFAPTATGTSSGGLSITSAQLSSPLSIQATGTGIAIAPMITSPPAKQSVTIGQTATFSVTASGTAPLSYQWLKNGVPILGANSPTYTTPVTTSSDNGAQFSVVVSNSAGTVTSAAGMLTAAIVAVPPSITSEPANQSIVAGQTATFVVAATGTAPLSYQWWKNGAAIAGAISSTYTTPAETTSDSGAQFSVVVTNSGGSLTSNAATLSVNPAPVAPSITTQPTSQTVTAGQIASFSVTATGTAPLSYQWRKNATVIGGATSSTYTTPATTSSDNGAQFTVLVSNSVGSTTSSSATLTVNSAAVAPSITAQPTSQTVTASQMASFSVTATGTAPLSYQWRKNGTSISGATSSTYTTPATTPSDNGAQLTVIISNSVGSITSSAATLTVNVAAVAPSITTQPTSQTVTSGQTATFSVTATGTAPLSYQWKKNGTAISGATSASYTTPATSSSDNGAQFAVIVNNSAGTVTSNAATLTVTTPGQLSASPVNLGFGNVDVGTSNMQTVMLTNSGGSNVSISNITISGAGFSVNGISTGLTVNPGTSVSMNVTFAPAASGSVTGSVTITSNAANSPTVISLSGTGQVVSHSATLNWTASTSTAFGYNIYRGSISGGPYIQLNSSANVTTSFTDSSVVSGQTYYYVVTAVDANNVESAYSNQVTAVIP